MTMPASSDRRPLRNGPTHTRPDHDETLIAGLAAGDLADAEAATARALVTSCPACAELHADLLSIMAATTALPAPSRTRDFRLTEADAARLRPRGWRRFVGQLADPRLAFTRPLAGSLIALGVAGLVLASLPAFLSVTSPVTTSGTLAPAAAVPDEGGVVGSTFGRASTLPGVAAGGADAALPSAAPTASIAAPAPEASDNRTVAGVRQSAAPTVGPVAPAKGSTGSPPAAAATTNPSILLLAGSVVLLALGLGLFALHWMARRPA